MSYVSPEVLEIIEQENSNNNLSFSEQEFDLSLFPFDEIPPADNLEKRNCSSCAVSFCVLPILLDKKPNFICNLCKKKI